MTRNILPKSEKLQMQMSFSIESNKCFSPNIASLCKEENNENNAVSKILISKMNSYSLSSSDDDDRLANNIDMIKDDKNNSADYPHSVQFSTIRLNQWHTNEEIFNILNSVVNGSSRLDKLSSDVTQRPNNGSIFLFDRRIVKNFKKDSFMWKRRKTGGTNSVREDRMYLKVNGIDCIYGCYSHSSIMSTFHRRCYWLVDKPDIVLVHYLQTPNYETGECSINLNFNSTIGSALISNTDANIDNSLPLNRDELCNELKAMLWPYYLIENFLNDNKGIYLNEFKSISTPNDFIDSILSRIFKNNLNVNNNNLLLNSQLSLRINLISFLNQSTQDILLKLKRNDENQNLNSLNMIRSPQHSNILSNNQDLPQKNDENTSFKIINNNDNNNIIDPKSSINVHLSLNSCSKNGGEKLFLISDWADENSESKYHILINRHKVDLKYLKKNVLQCILPKFDQIYHETIPNEISNTLIFIYENNQLYCEPLPFQIKESLKNEPNSSRDYLILLERMLILFDYFQINKFEYLKSEADCNSSFELRICNLTTTLINHFVSNVQILDKNKNNINSSLHTDPFTKINQEHHGKTILHLCAQLGLNSLMSNLIILRNFLLNSSKTTYNIIMNELDLIKLDNDENIPIVLACKHGYEKIAMELFKLHEYELMKPNQTTYSKSLHINHLMKAVQILNQYGFKELEIFMKSNLEKYQNFFNDNKMENDIIEKNLSSFTANKSSSNSIPTVLDDELHLIENLDDLTSLLSTDTISTGVVETSSPSQDLMFLSNDVKLISNNKNEEYQNLFSTFNQQENPSQDLIDLNLTLLDNNHHLILTNTKQQHNLNKPITIEQQQQQQQPTPHLVISQDDQDKKIKTLADNIIAAMPYKIKTNSYNSSLINNNTLIIQQNEKSSIEEIPNNDFLSKNNNIINHDETNEQSFMICSNRSANYLRRNATSFDDGYNLSTTNTRINSSPLITNNNNSYHRNSTGCYSSSTRSSLSPTSSTVSFHMPNNINQSRLLNDSSPAQILTAGDDSTCSSTFHIDSPPSTAEFCQYFHASSSSSYYKNAIETGFAQLTLTDDEQRELYEAALVIQNAYRRYIQRKKKKIKLDTNITDETNITGSNSNNSNNLNSTTSFVSSSNHLSLSRSSSTSLSSLNSNQSFQSSNLNNIRTSIISSIVVDHSSQNNKKNEKINLSDDDNNSTSSEDQKQYEAACIIQKYYRRYKQFENLHKYTEAAVKIQTRYRAYKSSSSKYRGSSSNQYSKLRNYCHHNSIDEALVDESTSFNQGNTRLNRSDLNLNGKTQFQKKNLARKLINYRQSPRFSPSASPLSPSPSQSNNILNNNNDLNQSNSVHQLQNSQLHHYHHHHHHFHHHFHNGANSTSNQNEIPDRIQTTNSNDSNQSIYDRSNLIRKIPDIQALNQPDPINITPSLTEYYEQNQLSQNNSLLITNSSPPNTHQLNNNNNIPVNYVNSDIDCQITNAFHSSNSNLNYYNKQATNKNNTNIYNTESNFWNYLTKVSLGV